MAREQLAALILAAGKGTRMHSQRPKVLHTLAGQPMLQWVIEAAETLAPQQTVVVVSPENRQAVQEAVPGYDWAVQETPLGTGDAVRSALAKVAPDMDAVLVLFGDTPLLLAETLQRLRDVLSTDSAVGMAVLGFQTPKPAGYGRLVRDSDGQLQKIVEDRDATAAEKVIELCNGGVMAFRRQVLADHMGALTANNAKGEYYLTDLVGVVRQAGWTVAVVDSTEEEVMGINNRVELAKAEVLLQQRLRQAALLAGVTMVDPASVFLSYDTEFGEDVMIEPNVIIGPGVRIGNDVEIFGHSHLSGCTLADGTRVGPFARLRPGTDVGEGARIGNFVETKAATFEAGAKANHLSYIGDAFVGTAANIGAGTITCNYDGFSKHKTHIGRDTFIGSNTALVAPVAVGDGANVAAGSVITDPVPDGALAIARGRQVTKPDRANALRQALSAAKKKQAKG